MPHARKIAYDKLVTYLKLYGYKLSRFTPGLWTNLRTGLTFTLMVEDFGIKFTAKSQVQHLINALEKKYKVTIDWTGNQYIRVTLDWNYIKRT